MVISIIILSITILFQFITNWKLLFDNRKLQKKIKSLETEIKQHDEIIPGDKVTFKMGLTYADKHSFDVVYEAEVIEVSDKKVKVVPYGAAEDSMGKKFPDGIKNKAGMDSLLKFAKNKWVDRKDIMPILDKGSIRGRKIDQLLTS